MGLRYMKIPMQLIARDGATIGVHMTPAAGVERGLLIFQNGTTAGAEMFDGMAAKLAERGITSWSVRARSHLNAAGKVLPDVGAGIHADDLARVVARARSLSPNTPAAVSGASFGAVVAMHFNVGRNIDRLPVQALDPVLLDQFLPFGDKLRLAGSMVSDTFGRMKVNTPMSLGKTLTTNPASPYIKNAAALRATKVPARVFRDVARMDLDIMARGRRATQGPVQYVYSGHDEVAINATTKLMEKIAVPPSRHIPSKTITDAPHDLSQQWHDPEVVDTISNFVLTRGVT